MHVCACVQEPFIKWHALDLQLPNPFVYHKDQLQVKEITSVLSTQRHTIHALHEHGMYTHIAIVESAYLNSFFSKLPVVNLIQPC